MKKSFILLWGITCAAVILVGGSQHKNAVAAKTGNLALVANGEDFVRQGFVSKDGWQINFDHVYVNFSNATAYSTESAYEPQKGDTKDIIEYQNKVEFLDNSQTVDLATGEADAQPITVAKADVPEGFYNALSWKLSPAETGSAIAGNTIAVVGKASKDGETIDFNLGFDRSIEYICGEFVGDERQGIVAADTPATVEATFHFDHIFGDADTPSHVGLNQDALGFQPLAELASNGTLQLDNEELASQLSAEDYQKLSEAVTGLGHVGEGHCEMIEE